MGIGDDFVWGLAVVQVTSSIVFVKVLKHTSYKALRQFLIASSM